VAAARHIPALQSMASGTEYGITRAAYSFLAKLAQSDLYSPFRLTDIRPFPPPRVIIPRNWRNDPFPRSFSPDPGSSPWYVGKQVSALSSYPRSTRRVQGEPAPYQPNNRGAAMLRPSLLRVRPRPIPFISARQVLNKINSYAPKPLPRLIESPGKSEFHQTGLPYYEETTWTNIKTAHRSLASSNGICSSFRTSVLFTKYCGNI
jgi:hypothetical protein